MDRTVFKPATTPFKLGQSEEKGTYRVFKRSAPEGAIAVNLSCHNCGYIAGLSHEIDDNGIITPSLVCPYHGCGYHEWGRLLNWEHGQRTVDGLPADPPSQMPINGLIPS